MKLPRDLSGRQLARALRTLGYEITREAGSHLRLTTMVRGQHHLTIPDHDSLRVGTLAAILAAVAAHHSSDKESREEFMTEDSASGDLTRWRGRRGTAVVRALRRLAE